MEQKATPSPGAHVGLERAAPDGKSPDKAPDVGHGLGQQAGPDRAAPVRKFPTSDQEGSISNMQAGKSLPIKHKFWIMAFLVAAMAILSWFPLREMADAWEHRGRSFSPALVRPVL